MCMCMCVLVYVSVRALIAIHFIRSSKEVKESAEHCWT